MADAVTKQQKHFPEGNFWKDGAVFERTCLCQRWVRQIKPALEFAALRKTVVYVRQTGNEVRHQWRWTEDWENDRKTGNIAGVWHEAITSYRARILTAMSVFARVRASCAQHWVTTQERDAYEQYLTNQNASRNTPVGFQKEAMGLGPVAFHGGRRIVTRCNFTADLPVLETCSFRWFAEREASTST